MIINFLAGLVLVLEAVAIVVMAIAGVKPEFIVIIVSIFGVGDVGAVAFVLLSRTPHQG